MQVYGATGGQFRVAEQVYNDMVAMGIVFPSVSVTFSDERLDEDDLGRHDEVLGRHAVELRTSLAGGLLYATLLHEYGHALGLGHTATGIMAARDGSGGVRKLTLRNRRKWLRQLLRSLNNRKLQELQ